MFKRHTHILLGLLLAGALAGLSSCKSKKESTSVKSPAVKGNVVRKDKIDHISLGYLYVEACLQRKKGNLQEALKLFGECRNLSPKDPAVHYEMGMIYKLLGANEQALAYAKFSADADPENEWYQLLLIDCYNSAGQPAQAVKVREALVKKYPAKNEFKEDLAIEYAILGYYDKSYRIYDELEKTYGISEQLTLNKVKLLKSQNKTREMEAELRKLSGSDPSESRYYGYLAEFYMEQNNLARAGLMYEQILKIDPGHPEVHLALHNYYSVQGKEAEAYEHLKKAFLNPDLDVETKAGILASFYNRAEGGERRAYEQGVELAVIMLEVHPRSKEANGLYGDFLRLDKKIKEAIVYYYKAAIDERREYRLWDNLLYSEYQLYQFDSLERHSARAIEFFPSLPMYYKYNGIANLELKNYKKAAGVLKDGLEFVLDNPNRLDFYSLLGDAYFQMKVYDKSDHYFEEALKINPDNTHVLNNYAYYLSLRAERLDRAEKLSKRANELRPNERSYLDTYGWILFRQKKYAEAEGYLKKAAAMGPKNPTILEHYGDVLYKLNRPEEALKQWEAARQSGGASEELDTKIKTKKLND